MNWAPFRRCDLETLSEFGDEEILVYPWYMDSPKHGDDEDDEDISWAEEIVDKARPEDVVDASQARLNWIEMKKKTGEQNAVLDELMSLVGMELVKQHFLAVKARFMTAKPRRARDAMLPGLHLVLQGNDGTGR